MGLGVGRGQPVVRVRFEPTRLSAEHLRIAYELLAPVRRLRLREPALAGEERRRPVEPRGSRAS